MKKRRSVTTSIVLLFLLLGCFPVKAQLYKFYDAKNGLSSSLINSILQDSEGYVWIATEDGLNRFDGNHFFVYRNIPGDSTSLPNNYIRNIMEDSKQRLWITTMDGLCMYDRTTDRFVSHPLLTYDKSRKIGQCFYLMEDREGYIWVSASANGVIRMDVENDEYQYFNVRNSAICSDHINVIYEDRFGNVWFGSGQQGLSIYNPSNGTFRTFRYHPENENGITSNAIASICEDQEGNVWIGTLTGGVNIYSFATQSFRKFDALLHTNNNEIGYLLIDKQQDLWIGKMGDGIEVYSTTEKKIVDNRISTSLVDLSRLKIQTMFEDRQGNIWMGLFEKGLFMVPRDKGFFISYSFNPYHPQSSVGSGAIQPVFSDSGSDIWMGVGGTSVYRFDKDMHIKKIYRPGKENPLLSNIVLSFYEDRNRNIWLGSYLNGAIRYNRATDRFDLNLVKGDPPYGLLSTHVSDMNEDADGRLWITTNGGGINIYDPQTRKFEYLYRNDADSKENQLIDNWCNQMYIDTDSLFWIATYRGISTYRPSTGQFTHYTTDNGKLPNDVVFCLLQDTRENMWAGTADGLVRISPDKENIRMFGLSDGLPNSLIHGIGEDKNGNLWISTNYGLSMFDPQTETFTNYTAADGLLTNELNRNAFHKTPEDLFFVGSIEGVTTFNPSVDTHEITEPRNLMFTNLYIFNEPIRVGNSAYGNVLDQTVNYTDQLSFTHKQNSFSIEFAALEYVYPQKVEYEVMMKGFDTHWRPAKNRMVTYTNLNPGDYTLQVRAWINEKENAVTKELKVKILPALWATPWAKFLYILALLILSYFLFRIIRERINTKRQEQLMQEKLQFFTDISHEIRTPLTLILSPLSKLIVKNKDVNLMATYNSMYKNGIRLLQLVNQVMDLRALEFGKKKLMVENTSINSFIRELKNSFNNLAEEKNITYSFTSVPEEIRGYIDRDTISKVLFNLISNAFKYTEKGAVTVALTIDGKQKLVISITDTGTGISKEKQSLIFERFYTATQGNERVNSSGIGLHLTRKLVELHHGEIGLQSKEQEGSTFIVTVPYRREDYATGEILQTAGESPLPDFTIAFEGDNNTVHRNTSTSPESKHKLLIVEDNSEIRQFLLSEFNSSYQVFEAENGQEGLRIAMEHQPDIILCDVLMPVMDGMEFCRKIRHIEQLAHTPLIMLTARTTIEQQIEGLEQGADAYIPKPFDMNYLKAQMDRLLKSRKNITKSQATVTEEEKLPVETPEKKLFRKLDELIESQLDNPDLSVDYLCRELALSRTHLNRKVKELTGDSPASYIRQRRLQQSVRLLKEKQLTVSEIAFAVGFSSPSYFSQAFRDYYGMTPKEYIGLEEK